VRAHDALTLIAAIDWGPIVVALITLAGVIFNGCLGAYVMWHLRTPSGTSIGKQVEHANVTAIVTHHRVEALAKELGVKASEESV
jgi:hypothetical protein